MNKPHRKNHGSYWFVCSSCLSAFRGAANFLTHKKDCKKRQEERQSNYSNSHAHDKNFRSTRSFKNSTSAAIEQKPKNSEAQEGEEQLDLARAELEPKKTIKKRSTSGKATEYICSVCKRRLNSLEGFKNHMRTHTGEKPFECKYCGKRFHNNYSHRRHELMHIGQRQFDCRYCGKNLSSNQGREIHELRRHTKDGKKFKCFFGSCDMKYYSKAELALHTSAVHTGERPFKCNQCGCLFMFKSFLQNHMQKHEGCLADGGLCPPIYEYECPYCAKKFVLKSSLNIHIRSHTGEKPFVCSECGKSFVDLSGLKRHAVVHTGEKPYKCEYCSQAFTELTGLRNHKLRHKGDRSFKCRFCPRTFFQKAHLQAHERQHTGETPFQCKFCSKTYRQLRSLNRHLKIHVKKNLI